MAYSSIPAMAALAIALAVPSAVLASEGPKEVVIVQGAVHDPDNAKYAQVPAGKTVPALPLVYDRK